MRYPVRRLYRSRVHTSRNTRDIFFNVNAKKGKLHAIKQQASFPAEIREIGKSRLRRQDSHSALVFVFF